VAATTRRDPGQRPHVEELEAEQSALLVEVQDDVSGPRHRVLDHPLTDGVARFDRPESQIAVADLGIPLQRHGECPLFQGHDADHADSPVSPR
jgi:hypothetical protein